MSRDAVSHVLGVPSYECPHEKIADWDEFFDMLRWNNRRLFSMYAGSNEAQADDGRRTINELNDEGIIKGHGYEIVSVHQIDYHGQKVQLFKMRNPWGDAKWRGDWSKESPFWTDKLKQELEYDESEEGVFYINLGDFSRHF